MVEQLTESPRTTHLRKILGKSIGPAARVEILEARLTACVAVLETLAELGHVPKSLQETVDRVVGKANDLLPK